MRCVEQRILKSAWGYAKQVYGAGSDRSSGRNGFGLSERPVSITDLVDRRDVISQQSVRQAVRRSAFDARAVLRKEWADRERGLEALAVEVLTALGERDAFVWDAERRAGQALRTMTDEEGFAPAIASIWKHLSGLDPELAGRPALRALGWWRVSATPL
jgi:hypothetical protein